jgi:hypothetical protein
MSRIAFECYHDEFQILIQSYLDSVTRDSNHLDDGTTSSSSSAAASADLLSQSEDLLKQMSMEARVDTNDAALQRKLMQTYELCKSQLVTLKQDQHRGVRAQRTGKGNDNEHVDQNLARQNISLERARRTMADAEINALQVTEELRRNRDTMEHTQDSIQDVNGMTNQARCLLNKLNRWQLPSLSNSK